MPNAQCSFVSFSRRPAQIVNVSVYAFIADLRMFAGTVWLAKARQDRPSDPQRLFPYAWRHRSAPTSGCNVYLSRNAVAGNRLEVCAKGRAPAKHIRRARRPKALRLQL